MLISGYRFDDLDIKQINTSEANRNQIRGKTDMDRPKSNVDTWSIESIGHLYQLEMFSRSFGNVSYQLQDPHRLEDFGPRPTRCQMFESSHWPQVWL